MEPIELVDASLDRGGLVEFGKRCRDNIRGSAISSASFSQPAECNELGQERSKACSEKAEPNTGFRTAEAAPTLRNWPLWCSSAMRKKRAMAGLSLH
jgi:hypothetical protein